METADRTLLPLIVADVFELAGLFRREGELTARRAGQTQARWQLLSAASGPQPHTVAQLARRLGVARQGVQRLAHELVRSGMAAYTANPDHRRSPCLSLTPAGRRTLARITAAAARSHRRLAAALAPGAAAALHTALRPMLAAVRRIEKANEK